MKLTRCDFALGLAPFRRRWGGVLSIVTLLGLTIGLAAAMGSLALFLYVRPLPWPNAHRMVMIGQVERGPANAVIDYLTLENFLEIRDHIPGAERVTAFTFRSALLRVEGEQATVQGMLATEDYFSVLGLQPLMGVLSLAASTQGAPPPIILSEELWIQIANRNPDILGQTVWLGEQAHTVAGILPAGTAVPGANANEPVQCWAPLIPSQIPRPEWRSRWYGTLALLAPGVDHHQLDALMPVLTARLKARFPDLMATRQLQLADLKAVELGEHWRFFVLLLGIGVLLAGIMVSNLGSLVLARMNERLGYLHIAQHLGATRLVVLRPIVIEHLLLVFIGTLLAIPIAIALRHQIVGSLGLAGMRLPVFDSFAFSTAALISGGVVMVVAIIGALIKARESAPGALSSRMSASRRTLSSDLALGMQTTLAGMLLVTCALLELSLRRQSETNASLPLLDLQRAHVILGKDQSTGPEVMLRTFVAIKTAFEARPEVARVALSGSVLLSEGNFAYRAIDDRDTVSIEDSNKRVYRDVVCPDYLEAAGLRIVRGRGFTAGDLRLGSHVVVVSQHVADLFWPGEDPIGRRFRIAHRSDDWADVIGVAQNIHSTRTTQPLPAVWRLWSNNPQLLGSVLLDLRPGARLSREEVERIVWSVAPSALVRIYQPVAEFVSWQWWFASAVAQLSRLLAAVATVVCAFGIFSLIDRRLAATRREVAIRKALGAPLGALLHHLASRELAWSLTGLGLGILLAQWLVPVFFQIESLQARDQWSAGALAAVGLLCATVTGTLIPALRMLALDPQSTLQET